MKQNSQNNNITSSKSKMSLKAVSGFAIVVLLLGFAAHPLDSVLAQVGVNTTISGSVSTNGADIHAKAQVNHQAWVTLQQAFQLDRQTYQDAATSAQNAYQQSIQTARFNHQQTEQNILQTFKTARDGVLDTYKTSIKSAHGNVQAIIAAMQARDTTITAATLTRASADMNNDVTRDKAITSAESAKANADIAAAVTRDTNDGSARQTYDSAIGANSTITTRDQTIWNAHVTYDQAIGAARVTKINADGNTTVTFDQAIGAAQQTRITAMGSADQTRDGAYSTNPKIDAQNNAAMATAAGNANVAFDQSAGTAAQARATANWNALQSRDQSDANAEAAMYATIASAYP
ncbi:MAG TPA: hypothetical protein VEU72_06720 [Nitrosopumilaceae archaeon]|nr:hypothetical protein [Nitrosopumilaceae archaeon]